MTRRAQALWLPAVASILAAEIAPYLLVRAGTRPGLAPTLGLLLATWWSRTATGRMSGPSLASRA